MQLLYSRCCGIDVHKNSVTACVLIYSGSVEPEVRKKEFATHKRALGYLSSWLHANQVTHVAMESTGVYWKPVWQALAGKFELTLANPYQIKTMPGRKTDARDCQWIAELFAHGLIRPSFVPPSHTRSLRDLTRYRVKLVEEHNRIHNRIHKVLEDACIKLDTVVSDILGVSGRRIIRAILAGYHDDPGYLAYEVRGSLRGKMPQLRLALSGRVTDHHRFLLRELMDDLERVESKMQCIEAEIALRVDIRLVERLCSIPVITAWTLLAELGCDMAAFFYRQAAKQGVRKAIVSLAHRILVIAFCLLRDSTDYHEFGGDFFDQLNPVRTRNRLIRRLQKLGLDLTLTPRPDFPVVPTSPPTARKGADRANVQNA